MHRPALGARGGRAAVPTASDAAVPKLESTAARIEALPDLWSDDGDGVHGMV